MAMAMARVVVFAAAVVALLIAATAPAGVLGVNVVSIRKHNRLAAGAGAGAGSGAAAGEHDHNARADKMMAQLEAGDSGMLDAMESNIDKRLAETKSELAKIVDFRKRAMGLLQSKLAELATGGDAGDKAEADSVRAALAIGERLDAKDSAEDMRLAQEHSEDEAETDAKTKAAEAALDEDEAESEAEGETEGEEEGEAAAAAAAEDDGSAAEDFDLSALADEAEQAAAHMAASTAAAAAKADANAEADAQAAHATAVAAAAAAATAHAASAPGPGHRVHPHLDTDVSAVDALIALDDEEQSTRAALGGASDEFARMRLAASARDALDAATEQQYDASLDLKVSQLKANLTRIHVDRVALFRHERLHPNRLLRIGHDDANASGLSRAAMLQADRDRLKLQLGVTSVYGTDATSAMEDHLSVAAGGGGGWDSDASSAHAARQSLMSWISLIDAELADLSR